MTTKRIIQKFFFFICIFLPFLKYLNELSAAIIPIYIVT